jgi:FkbM family methyltransferase
MKKILKSFIINNKFFYLLFLPIIKLKRFYLLRSFKNFEKLFSNVVGGSMVVTMSNISGRYEIDSRSHILERILITKAYEPDIVNLISQKTPVNKDAINVGANIGLYSNLLAELINTDKKVLAIEPTPGAFKYLEANIKRNKNCNKIFTFNGIATDVPGLSKINIIEGKEEYSSVGVISHYAVEKEKCISVDIEGDTIDQLVEKFKLQPGIIVIDVEGSEYQVLKGAIETIRKFKPIIISELDDKLLKNLNTTTFQVVELLEMNGYTVTDVENNKLSFPFTGGNVIASPNFSMNMS